MQDADQPVGELADGGVVAEAAGSLLVAERRYEEHRQALEKAARLPRRDR